MRQTNKKLVIIHGTFGHPEENRFPRLTQESLQLGYDVYVPTFPTPENQTPQTRCDTLQKQVPYIFDSNTTLVGHSLWATYLLHILDQERKEPIQKAILVSWFVHTLWIDLYDKLNKPFLEKQFDRTRIQKNVVTSVIFHGDNDPYVPLSEAEYLQQHLWAQLRIIPWWWHLNTEAWYTTLPQLLEEL